MNISIQYSASEYLLWLPINPHKSIGTGESPANHWQKKSHLVSTKSWAGISKFEEAPQLPSSYFQVDHILLWKSRSLALLVVPRESMPSTTACIQRLSKISHLVPSHLMLRGIPRELSHSDSAIRQNARWTVQGRPFGRIIAYTGMVNYDFTVPTASSVAMVEES
ncbi:hypothetical protein EYZ11_005788 [Aspergillus tanneri]|uniref:Uncharacterized protein n=1 Tax=Aspergillus tanneri TaxID=1220188 RepID=A0A4S3JH56_9EURO|nr:hypothetical protein EYZ11_005788 [Aspergillus tanneri]